jgi:hypothetical protein
MIMMIISIVIIMMAISKIYYVFYIKCVSILENILILNLCYSNKTMSKINKNIIIMFSKYFIKKLNKI